MSGHTCKSIVVTCIDFRFQKFIDKWIKENLTEGSFDRVALAGGVFNLDEIKKQVATSKRLHNTQEAILCNHENCGAYGTEGSFERHAADLLKARGQILEAHPDMDVRLFIIHLDGTFQSVEETQPQAN